MAITAVLAKQGVMGDHRYAVIDVTGDASSYATGGFSISALLATALPVGTNPIGALAGLSNGTHWLTYDTTNKKVQFRLQTTGAEVGNGLSTATTARITILGK